MDVTVDKGVTAGRHTHPGVETSYVMEGIIEKLPNEGQPTRDYKVGEAFQVPPNTPHAGGPAGKEKVRLLTTYVWRRVSRSLLPRDSFEAKRNLTGSGGVLSK
jgi:quercetin dioxygenase-like cupin family protein